MSAQGQPIDPMAAQAALAAAGAQTQQQPQPGDQAPPAALNHPGWRQNGTNVEWYDPTGLYPTPDAWKSAGMPSQAQPQDQTQAPDPMTMQATGQKLPPAPPTPDQQPRPTALPQWAKDQGLLDPSQDGSPALISMLQGPMLNFEDEIAGAGAAAQHNFMPFITGKPTNFQQDYQDVVTPYRNAAANYQKQHPGVAMGAQLAASIPAMGAAGVAEDAAANAPGFFRTMGGAMTTGGAYGAAAGAGSGDNLTDRLSGAGRGAAVGTAFGAAMAPLAFAGVGVANKLASVLGAKAPSTVTPAQTTAAKLLLSKMGEDSLTVPSAAAQLRADPTGQMTLADIGGENSNTQRLARALVTLPGQQSKDITTFMNGRDQAQFGRFARAIKTNLSDTTDTYGLADSLTKARSKAAAPLYDEAFAHPPVITDELKAYAESPEVQKGFAQGVTLAKREAITAGKKFDPNAYGITDFNSAGDPIIGPVPTWRAWHAAKEGMDDEIEQHRDLLTGKLPDTKEVNSMVDFKNGLLTQLKSVNPAYKEANLAWSGPSQSKTALSMGQDFLKADPEQIDMAMGRLSPSDQDFYRVGAARALRDKIQSANDNADLTKRIFGNPEIRIQISRVFGPDASAQFTRRMMSEKTMNQTSNFLTGGSQTANKIGDLMKGTLLRQVAADVVQGGLAGFMSGGPKGAAIAAIGLPLANAGKNFAASIAEKSDLSDPQNASELARLLITPGNAGADALETVTAPTVARNAAKSARGKSLARQLQAKGPLAGIAAGGVSGQKSNQPGQN